MAFSFFQFIFWGNRLIFKKKLEINRGSLKISGEFLVFRGGGSDDFYQSGKTLNFSGKFDNFCDISSRLLNFFH
jgi:hypothetical protein